MKRKLYIVIVILSLYGVSCGQTRNNKNNNQKYMFTNELINESSPYLLQHAHNPVNWYPWNESVLKKASEENKMLIISIGYSACHWCHVMEHESFEDTTVARIMNDHFICIKVDREERPDLDQVYMNAAYLVTGSGGWPLNVLALPDGKPFFAGTYFPKENWIKVLEYFIELKNSNPSSLSEQADKITKGIRSTELVELNRNEEIMTTNDLDNIYKNLEANIDFKKGGMNSSPKFPMPSNWEYLMEYYHLSKNPEALEAVTTTLNNIAFGGIYDHVGGGFSRYSTDKDWLVPHFEKMLYDNAQLVSLYSHAWQLTKNPLYKETVYQTLGFINREMTSEEGGFYSSFDADSEGEEGKFYIWSKEEIESILKNDAPLFIEYYNITNSGNWENGKNILHRKLTDEDFSQKHNINLPDLKKKISNSREAIMKARNLRVKPGLDDKILTSWNALMLRGYIQAYRAFGEEKFLKAALINASFIEKNALGKNNYITRNYKNGKSTIPGLLDDYSFTISAFIELYQATFDEHWLLKANQLAEYTIEHFYDTTSGMFYYTHNKHSELIARKMEVADNVIPSSNSEMAKNLLLLGHYFYNDSFIQKARQMLVNVQSDLIQNINYYSNWGSLSIQIIKPLFEVAVVGNDYDQIMRSFDSNYLPDAIFIGGKNEGTLKLLENKLISGKTTIYICKNKACKLPVNDVVNAMQQMK
jgi:uncharacterized protein